MQTLVRIFFDDDQVCGIVIPDHDEELDLHHGKLITATHKYVDMTNEEYMLHVIKDGLPNIPSLHAVVKNHPKVKVAK